VKNRIIGGLLAIVSGALVAFGPHTLFKICEQSHHEGASVCFWTGQVAIGIGIVLILLGIVYLFVSNPQIHVGLSIGIVATFVLLFLVANVLIGMDDMETMACRIATLPALNVITIVSVVLAGINIAFLSRKPSTPVRIAGQNVHASDAL
jgi:hypothetical protein